LVHGSGFGGKLLAWQRMRSRAAGRDRSYHDPHAEGSPTQPCNGQEAAAISVSKQLRRRAGYPVKLVWLS
jgi:hypothetical protein